MNRDLLERAWAALGGNPELLHLVRAHGSSGLPSRFDVGALALGAVGAQRLAAQELLAASHRPVERVVLDAAHIGVAFRSERFLRVDGRPSPAGFAPLSRFLRTQDGWVRLHTNYPHHHRAVIRAVGTDVTDAVARRTSEEVEGVVMANGGVAAAVRTPEQWAEHPQGRAVAAQPLLRLQKVAASPPQTRALPGLRVLDLTRVIAGPVGTRTLASYGADVLRIDSPRLVEDLSTLLDTGSGKRQTQLDLDERGDRRRFDELLAAADVLVHGYRPGALDRYGLSPEALAERLPDLIVVTLSAWGDGGPWRHRRGFDSIVQAATGIAHTTRSPDGTPGVLPAQALDHGSGHLLAATVMRALVERGRHGGTWHGQLSLAQLAHWLLTTPSRGQDPVSGEPDPAPYYVNLPSPLGALTVIGPPGSPNWTRGLLPVEPEQAAWLAA